jgi:hypothetical protein
MRDALLKALLGEVVRAGHDSNGHLHKHLHRR